MPFPEVPRRRQTDRDRAVDELRVVTIRQAAEILGISVWTLKREIAAGRGPKVTQLSDRRVGITLGNIGRYEASRERP